MDEICMHSAATGKVIGFDGRVLQVCGCICVCLCLNWAVAIAMAAVLCC
jgi:hypothetical protein